VSPISRSTLLVQGPNRYLNRMHSTSSQDKKSWPPKQSVTIWPSRYFYDRYYGHTTEIFLPKFANHNLERHNNIPPDNQTRTLSSGGGCRRVVGNIYQPLWLSWPIRHMIHRTTHSMPSDRHTQSLGTSTGPNQEFCLVLPSRPRSNLFVHIQQQTTLGFEILILIPWNIVQWQDGATSKPLDTNDSTTELDFGWNQQSSRVSVPTLNLPYSAGKGEIWAVIEYCFRSRSTTGVWEFSAPHSSNIHARTIDFGPPVLGRKFGSIFEGSAFSRQTCDLSRDWILFQIKVHDGCLPFFGRKYWIFLGWFRRWRWHMCLFSHEKISTW
jgi:hypothetical protein